MIENDVVKIINLKQAIKYMENGVNPINVFYTNKLVFEFKKSDTKDLYNKWTRREI